MALLKEHLNRNSGMEEGMSKKLSTFDGIAALIFVLGAATLIFSDGQRLANLAWVLMVIGILKQFVEWR